MPVVLAHSDSIAAEDVAKSILGADQTLLTNNFKCWVLRTLTAKYQCNIQAD